MSPPTPDVSADADRVVARLLTAPPRPVADPAALTRWAADNRRPGERLVDALVRCGLLRPAAGRTAELMRKGFVAADPAALLPADGPARLQAAVAAAHPPATERVTAAADRPPPDPGARPVRAEVGQVLGKCLITGVLGQGGHGVVLSALHQTLNIPVAVKVLLGSGRAVRAAGGSAVTFQPGSDAAFRRRLRHEAQVLARLSHPHVVRVLDFDEWPVPYVVLEFVDGPTLADLIDQSGGLRPARAAEVVGQCAGGLAAAWELGVVHRDIKPANVLLTKGGMAKLADLGLALTAGGEATPDAAGGVVGTYAYMAPEQARTADEVDFRTDIYSLGATFYHAVTGRLPFVAKSARELVYLHATAPVVPPHLVAPDHVDRATSDLIVRMMAKDADDRFASYADLLAALAALPAAAPAAFPAPTLPAPARADATDRPSGILSRLFRRPPD